MGADEAADTLAADPAPAPAAAHATVPAAAPPALPDLSPAACAAQLAQRFPALFAAGRALPVKLRIQTDIQQRAPGVFSKKSLSLFLHRHTTSTAYIKALVNAQQRVDLDGAPAGDIADEHRQAASAELARRLALVQARQTAERDGQRRAAGARGQRSRPEPAAAGLSVAPAADPPASRQPVAARAAQRLPRPQQQQPAPPPPAQRPAESRLASSAASAAQVDPAAAAAARAHGPAIPPAEAEARRQRGALLRAFETTTLTAANFCALKGLTPAALESLLAQARQERAQWPAPAQATDTRVGNAGTDPRQRQRQPPAAGDKPRNKPVR